MAHSVSLISHVHTGVKSGTDLSGPPAGGSSSSGVAGGNTSSSGTFDEETNRLYFTGGYIDYGTAIRYFDDGSSEPIVPINATGRDVQVAYLLDKWKESALNKAPESANASSQSIEKRPADNNPQDE